MAEDNNEHLSSFDCSSGNFETSEHRPVGWFTKAKAKRCVTHHFGCDCREYRFERMREALIRIMVWAEHDCIRVEPRQKAMAEIAKACREGLEQ